ncbi:MAG TPA: M1 family aminopeptidase, partial [Bdellovibrio sp.]|nr:M1 family aminopeptidase [Bdellovibrio sp.]
GLISTDGATLFGNTYWIPTFLEAFKSFDISIQTPAEWSSLSQGQMVSREAQGTNLITRYKEIYPQEDVYLVAGPWKSYESDTSTGKNLRVFLRKDDSALAQNFLTTMPDYIQHYSELIAPYPYNSFSVVENIWETGYGMPSFTLLGPSVVRLPFILTSSLPHEILHNWWGNGVYVDYEKGNWSEGLTTYMADYWQQEKINADAAYRLKTLANFSDFVSTNPANDFPVRQFKGRHNSSSQAVGYGKSMMFFHMLDQRFGRDVFNKALQNFYNDNLFRRASFSDLQKSFEKTTNQKLDSFFTQWLDRKGAPQIELSDVKVMHWADGSYATTYELKQKQEGPYELSIPVTLTLPSGETKNQTTKMSEKSQSFTIVTSSRPTKISIDPDFHVFRNLYDEERPATLSIIFGNPAVHFFYNEKTPGTSSFV